MLFLLIILIIALFLSLYINYKLYKTIWFLEEQINNFYNEVDASEKIMAEITSMPLLSDNDFIKQIHFEFKKLQNLLKNISFTKNNDKKDTNVNNGPNDLKKEVDKINRTIIRR